MLARHKSQWVQLVKTRWYKLWVDHLLEYGRCCIRYYFAGDRILISSQTGSISVGRTTWRMHSTN
ncbi:hypothetical protein [Ruthenibacterium lactatiformans]|uniref:hypothetical protein n=1 Tax=Ruthenibacterium lactatiformans TaxID=1550024 RepID=UPI002046F773|nr:MAG TPA: hypothetical protein [Caudoviricetes sp.]